MRMLRHAAWALVGAVVVLVNSQNALAADKICLQFILLEYPGEFFTYYADHHDSTGVSAPFSCSYIESLCYDDVSGAKEGQSCPDGTCENARMVRGCSCPPPKPTQKQIPIPDPKLNEAPKTGSGKTGSKAISQKPSADCRKTSELNHQGTIPSLREKKKVIEDTHLPTIRPSHALILTRFVKFKKLKADGSTRDVFAAAHIVQSKNNHVFKGKRYPSIFCCTGVEVEDTNGNDFIDLTVKNGVNLNTPAKTDGNPHRCLVTVGDITFSVVTHQDEGD